MGKYIEMNKIPLKYRFTEEKYNMLPEEDIKKIKPLSSEYSNLKWVELISDSEDHFMSIKLKKELPDKFCNDCGWGNEEKEVQTEKDLRDRLKLDDAHSITFFWNSNIAVETNWGIFLKYWSDFCYCSDDSNILVIHNFEKVIIYVEDNLWVVNRSDYFK